MIMIWPGRCRDNGATEVWSKMIGEDFCDLNYHNYDYDDAVMIMICSKIMHDISVIWSNLYSIPGVYLYLYFYFPLYLYLIKPVFHPRCIWKWWGLLVLTWFNHYSWSKCPNSLLLKLCVHIHIIYIYQPSLEGRPSELHNEKPESVNNRNQGWKRWFGDMVSHGDNDDENDM